MRNRFIKAGMLLPLILFASVSIVFLVMFVHYMSSGYNNQVAHVDESIRCQAIAESAFSTMQARVRDKPYSMRFFAGKGFRESGIRKLDGDYDLFVVDTPGKDNQADVYVEARYQRARKFLFWRMLFETSILDATGKSFPLLFTPLPQEKFSSGSAGSPADDYVNGILKQRNDNRKDARLKAGMIKPLTSLKSILDLLDAPKSADIVDSNDPIVFTPPEVPLPDPPKAGLTNIFDEDFEGYSDGQYPAGWTMVTKAGIGVNAQVTTLNGKRCLRLQTKGGLARSDSYPVKPDSNNFESEADIFIDNSNTTCYLALGSKSPLHTNSSGASAVFWYNGLRFEGGSGKVTYGGLGGTMPQVGTWSPGRWIHVKVALDFAEKCSTVYIDDNLSGEKLPICPNTQFYDPDTGQTENLEKFMVGIEGADGVDIPVVYYDNIKLAK